VPTAFTASLSRRASTDGASPHKRSGACTRDLLAPRDRGQRGSGASSQRTW